MRMKGSRTESSGDRQLILSRKHSTERLTRRASWFQGTVGFSRGTPVSCRRNPRRTHTGGRNSGLSSLQTYRHHCLRCFTAAATERSPRATGLGRSSRLQRQHRPKSTEEGRVAARRPCQQIKRALRGKEFRDGSQGTPEF